MSEIQANCPHCGTSFSVSSEQLKVANGHVRCGVCMKVFKAGDVAAEPAAPAPPQAPDLKIAPEFQVEPEPSAASTESPNQNFVQMEDDSDIEDWIKKNQKTGNANIQSGLVDAPENLDKESLSLDDEISDAFEGLTHADDPGGKDFTSADESPVEEATPAFAAKLDDDELINDELSDTVSRGHDPLKQTQIGAGISEDEVDILEDAFGSVGDVEDDPFAINDEPLVHVALGSTEIEEPDTLESRLKPKILWPSLMAGFSLILLIQMMVKNFDELAIDPDYRGLYSSLCGIGICDLPTLKDVSFIKGNNLVVRPHPKQNGALIVDAMVNNQAPFDQPFPKLYLSFSNAQGKVVASRVFTPKEYLQGELKKLNALPSNTPLHLSLELMDPGEEAGSYHIDFL
jgi:predicted Zn finger-like uncharacterized protein